MKRKVVFALGKLNLKASLPVCVNIILCSPLYADIKNIKSFNLIFLPKITMALMELQVSTTTRHQLPSCI